MCQISGITNIRLQRKNQYKPFLLQNIDFFIDVFGIEDLNSITTMQIPFTLVPIRNIYGLAERLVPGLSGKIELKVGLLMSLVGK